MNFGTPVPLLLGIVLILGAVALFFLDKLKPGYGRDSDKVYAILWLISGVFLLGHLTMDLLPSFQQLLMTGMLITVTIENIYSRTPRDERYASQAVGESSSRGDYYPSRPRDYRGGPRIPVRAELDNEESYRPRFAEDQRMLRGRDEPPRRPDYYDDGYRRDRYANGRGAYSNPATPPFERSVERLNPSSDRNDNDRYWDERDYSSQGRGYPDRYQTPPRRDDWDDEPTVPPARRRSPQRSIPPETTARSASPNRDRGPSRPSRGGFDPRSGQDESSVPASYVDYRPVNLDNPEQAG